MSGSVSADVLGGVSVYFDAELLKGETNLQLEEFTVTYIGIIVFLVCIINEIVRVIMSCPYSEVRYCDIIYDVVLLGEISVQFDGFGPLNWILEWMAGYVTDSIKDALVGWLEGPLKDIIQSVLNNIPLDKLPSSVRKHKIHKQQEKTNVVLLAAPQSKLNLRS